MFNVLKLASKIEWVRIILLLYKWILSHSLNKEEGANLSLFIDWIAK